MRQTQRIKENTNSISGFQLNRKKEKSSGSKPKKCGLSISEYLKKLGLGYEPTSIMDNQKVNELAKINGDLGRLGGLLKLWLSDDRRAAHFDKKTINGLLKDIEETRTQMTGIMMKIINSKK